MLSLLAIVGQTASGKSSLAVKLALKLKGEIVSADSRTVYKGLDIATAKPSLDDQRLVKHHLLDIADYSMDFNVKQFQGLAFKSITDIRKRGLLPILAGGSGLYVDSVLYSYTFPPSKPNQPLRSELNHLSVAELRDRIAGLGLGLPENAMNKRYLIRTLEIGGSGVAMKSGRPLRNALVIGLRHPKHILEKRIRGRLQAMMELGLLDEVGQALQIYKPGSEALKSNICLSLKPYFESRISLSEALEDFVIRDLRLAKKQMTWFKRNKDVVWFSNSQEAYEYVLSRYGAGHES